MAVSATSLPTNRTISNTPTEHVSDHNSVHQAANDLTAILNGWATTDRAAKAYVASDHGVVGDGIADDSTAFQSFVNTAATLGMEAQLAPNSIVRLVTMPT